MAEIIIPNIKIQIEIPNLVLGGVELKRKAELHSFTYDQVNKYLALAWKVEFFETVGDDEYGELITKQGINPYIKNVEANNSIKVEVATGIEIYPREVVTTDAETGVVTKTMEYDQAIVYTGQYDWFNMIAEADPIHVHGMIRAYGLRTNWN